jgi:hypothetical protein
MPTPKRMRAKVGKSDMNFMMLKDDKWGTGGRGIPDDPAPQAPKHVGRR